MTDEKQAKAKAADRRARLNAALRGFKLKEIPEGMPEGEDRDDLVLDAIINLMCALSEGRGSNYGERHELS